MLLYIVCLLRDGRRYLRAQNLPIRKKDVRRKPRPRFWTDFGKVPWKIEIAVGVTQIPI